MKMLTDEELGKLARRAADIAWDEDYPRASARIAGEVFRVLVEQERNVAITYNPIPSR